MQLLVVEDDARMAALLTQAFTEAGHAVTTAGEGAEALEIAEVSCFDALVLDVMLPGLDGLSVARKLRDIGNRTPILMLTAKDRLNDIVTGLDTGADDYLTKPFALDELLARVRALCRRGPVVTPIVLALDDLTLNTSGRIATRAGQAIALTPTQYLLLELLMRNAGRVISRDTILANIWGHHSAIEENTVEAFVSALRARVDHGFPRKLIHTVRGVGYVIRRSAD